MLHGSVRRPFKAMKRAIVDDFERRYLEKLLARHDFNTLAVARAAGLSHKHMTALIHKHGLDERVLIARVHLEPPP